MHANPSVYFGYAIAAIAKGLNGFHRGMDGVGATVGPIVGLGLYELFRSHGALMAGCHSP